MTKPRLFLGSSGKQAKLLQSLARGLEDVADVEPWTATFNPGTTTLGRLVQLTREVDLAAFVFAQDDWTSTQPAATAAPAGSEGAAAGQASPRDNVVFEAGLFGGVLGMERTFILHANGAKLPTDLLGLTCVRYGDSDRATEVRAVNRKLRKAIEDLGSLSRVEGMWWQFSVTERSADESSAVSLLRVSRHRDGTLEVSGRSWQEDGTLYARYASRAARETTDPAGVFYFWRGERPRHPNAPAVYGTGEFALDSPDRATGSWTTRSDADPALNARTSGVFVRAGSGDLAVLDGRDSAARAALIAERLEDWRAVSTS
jgi:hypothetical protein